MARGKGLTKSCILLIVVGGLERFTFKGVSSDMVTYLTEMVKMSNSAAAKTVNNWCGFTSLVPLAVAPVADTFFDRYSAILASSFFYVLGLLALTSRALDWPWRTITNNNKISSSLLTLSLPLISLGLGGFNTSLQAFGADQLENNEEELPRTNNNQDDNDNDNSNVNNMKSLFFHWWYFGICCGSLLGVSIMSYVQDSIGWGLGFAIPTVVMLLSITLFLTGTRFYTIKNSKEFNISRAIKGIVTSRFKNCTKAKEKPNVVHLEVQDHHNHNHNPLYDQDANNGTMIENGGNYKDCYMKMLQMTKVIVRLLPIWTTMLMFAVIFQQPATFFTRQGMTMERNIGSKFKIPPAALQSAITISIIVLMPLYNKVIMPLSRAIMRDEKGITLTQRIGVGMFLSVVAMVVAASTERKRLEISNNQSRTTETGEVEMSIFWLLPQYILLGISDIFTVVGMQEFFYEEVPVDVKTLGIALYTSVFGVGNFLGSVIISIVEHFTSSEDKHHGWFSDDMSKARLDKYYWLLAFCSSVSLIAFIILCKFQRCRS